MNQYNQSSAVPFSTSPYPGFNAVTNRPHTKLDRVPLVPGNNSLDIVDVMVLLSKPAQKALSVLKTQTDPRNNIALYPPVKGANVTQKNHRRRVIKELKDIGVIAEPTKARPLVDVTGNELVYKRYTFLLSPHLFKPCAEAEETILLNWEKLTEPDD